MYDIISCPVCWYDMYYEDGYWICDYCGYYELDDDEPF
jgi:hypothetical protein